MAGFIRYQDDGEWEAEPVPDAAGEGTAAAGSGGPHPQPHQAAGHLQRCPCQEGNVFLMNVAFPIHELYFFCHFLEMVKAMLIT